MKKRVIFIGLAVAVAFVWAVGLCLQALRAPVAVFSAEEMKMKIVLDAGHGGVDGGVVGVQSGEKESDINLSVTLKLKEELEDMGFAVTLTRKTAEGLYGNASKGFKRRDMQKRKQIVQEVQPDLFISVHQNFYPSQSTRGAQVFYKQKSADGEQFALCLQETLNDLYQKEGVKDRKVKSGDYFMLSCAPCPSVIVECGFLSNPKDDALLTSSAWQRRLAQSIATGVARYLSLSASQNVPAIA